MTAARSSLRGGSAPLLSLRQAATLAGVPRRALRARVRRGEIPVRVIGKGRAAKLRLTPAALAGAGLLGDELAPVSLDAPPPAGSPDPGALLELIREQGARIAALEDQRFQLAGQLGAAVERVRALEERLLALADPSADLPSPGSETQGRVVREAGTRRATGSAPASPPDQDGGDGRPRADPGAIPATGRAAIAQAPPPGSGAGGGDGAAPATSPAREPGSGQVPGGHTRAWRAGAFVRRSTMRIVHGADVGPSGVPPAGTGKTRSRDMGTGQQRGTGTRRS